MRPTRAILVDANLLVLLIVGLESPAHISRHKRTRQYSISDFALLKSVIIDYDNIAATPHILTEASNLLASQTGEPLRSALLRRLGSLILTLTEHAPVSADVVRTPLYLRLGLTDAAISLLTGRVAAVITADLDLFVALAKASGQSVKVINFTHLQFGTT